MSNNDRTLGHAIKQARERLGLTFGQAGNRTGLDPSTIWKAEGGKRVTYQTVVALARGLEGNAQEWLALAGFAEPVEAPTGAEVLDAGIAQLAAELDRPLRIQFSEDDKAQLSVLDAAEALAVYRKQAAEGKI